MAIEKKKLEDEVLEEVSGGASIKAMTASAAKFKAQASASAPAVSIASAASANTALASGLLSSEDETLEVGSSLSNTSERRRPR